MEASQVLKKKNSLRKWIKISAKSFAQSLLESKLDKSFKFDFLLVLLKMGNSAPCTGGGNTDTNMTIKHKKT
jgi:hypothetical protein